MQFAFAPRKEKQSAAGFVRATGPSLVGEIAVLCSARGLREVTVRPRRATARDRNRSAATPAEARSVQSPAKAGAALARQALSEIGEYLAGRRREFAVPLDLEGTPFQVTVWKALLEIPYGETRSYGAIARRIGRPQAARAVGSANRSNPIPLIVPCHRVIAGDGSLGGYAGGLGMKTRLLRLEQGNGSRAGKFSAVSRSPSGWTAAARSEPSGKDFP